MGHRLMVDVEIDGAARTMKLRYLRENLWEAHCPYHDDTTERCVIDFVANVYHCFSCGLTGEARLGIAYKGGKNRE